jgi:hypothetical protein
MAILQKVVTDDYATMGDAAFANNLDGTDFDAVAGYLHSPMAYHAWSEGDFFTIPGPKLPIYVATMNGTNDANASLEQLKGLGVPFHQGKYVAYDLETRVDRSCVGAYGALMQHYGFKVLVYGSASTVFNNPQLNGYWVADYVQHRFMYSHMGVRMTQCIEGELYDVSTVKKWTLGSFWR